jgi:CubicO group peptidase (beta-lactamase class C family)
MMVSHPWKHRLGGLAATALIFVAHSSFGQPPVEPFTWANLENRWDELGEAGFSGVILVVRDGKIALHKAYGLANRESKVPNTIDTIFAIGSTPIDFTKVGILLLAERDKLQLSDPITKYFTGVPPDKQGITIRHLMTGRSGLQDFHDLPSDADPDHTWIDRDEAVRRILDQKLLFEPGSGRQHSHSAWGLLAAVIEIVSGQTYPEFTREHLFGPAGMKDTGFSGEEYPLERMAIGYGPKSDGKINAPPYWGPTSWLVMGSGGQVSTSGDLLRWVRALREGKILSDESTADYFEGSPGRVLSGGDMYGYEVLYSDGQDSLFILLGNAGPHGGPQAWRDLARDLVRLVSGQPVAKFTLGVAMEIGEGGSVRVEQVLPGSAAERDGLQVGDVLISVDGKPLSSNPMAVLSEYLATGRPIPLAVERAGKAQEIIVTPKPRE